MLEMKRNIFIGKRQYKSNILEPLTLKEYLMFRDKVTWDKFIIVNFLNNERDTINTMKFEIKQFNKEKQLIRKAEYIYNNLAVKGLKQFVPYGKIPIDTNCEFIKIKLLSAYYETKKWVDGKWEELNDNPKQNTTE